MNKRIRELAEQAGFELWQDEPWNPGDLIDWSARYDDEFIKFAELIVKECIPFVGDPTSEAVQKMMKHFGVEEWNSTHAKQ